MALCYLLCPGERTVNPGMNPVIPENVLTKLAKLQALSERAGSEAEAANAAARVAEICARHNIDVGSVKIEEEEKEASERTDVVSGPRKAWTFYLADACNHLFGVKNYTSRGFVAKQDRSGRVVGSQPTTKMVFYGLRASVEGALLTYRYLLASVESLLAGWVSEGNRLSLGVGRSFRMGCSKRIFEMAYETSKQQTKIVEGNSESRAIVLIGNRLMEVHRKKMGLRSGGWISGASSGNAFGAGYSAGERVDIHGARTSKLLG